jgi:hypothetical protein
LMVPLCKETSAPGMDSGTVLAGRRRGENRRGWVDDAVTRNV